ncbi:unnamed protein product [Blepharisma stoltei]|uniref:Uncharacterized protein n=1 Tax=Blepharisma stoltei TaxID=1481888 RepID=A0AAU9KEE5_9CILI|nr:unnamed protein product [Blepharisma stoltei]
MKSNNFQSLSSDDEEASVRTVEIQRELENLKELMCKAKISGPEFQTFKMQTLSKQQQIKNLSIIESVHDILLQYSKGPQIYSLLANLCASYKIPLNIPETLLFISSIQYPIFLHTNKGYINCEISKNSLDLFFAKTVENLNDNKSYPKYIHTAMNDRERLCFSIQEAKDLFANCPHYTHRLQKYITPSTNFASKIRVHWTSANKMPKMYSISNTTPIINRQNYESRILPLSKSQKSEINKKLKTSLTLSTPFRPILRSKTRQPSIINKNKSPEKNFEEINSSFFPETRKTHKRYFSLGDFTVEDSNKQSEETDFSKFTAKIENYEKVNVVASSQPISEINNQLKTIASLINTFMIKKQNCLEELLVDFIKDSKGNFLFLACKRYKIKGEKSNENFPLKKLPSKHNIQIPFPEIFISENQSPEKDQEIDENLYKTRMMAHKEQIAIEKTQLLIEKQSSELEIKKSLNVSFAEISEKNKEDYLIQRKSDKNGKIPYNIIGIMPHNKNNQLISFIEKQKEPALKPLRHKERSKNLFWIGSHQISPMKYTEIMSKSIDKIAKNFDKRKRAAEEGRKGNNKKEIINNSLI